MKYTLTFFGILMVAFSYAQSNNLPTWHFGLKGDLNLSNIAGQGMANGFTPGFQLGGYAERTFNSKWGLQAELLFTQNNAKRASLDNFQTYYPADYEPFSSEQIKLAYISVPVLLKYNVTPAFSFLAGPEYSQMVVDAESLLSNNHNNAFKKYEVSVNAGAQFNTGRVSIYGRYNHGLNNIQNIPGDSRYNWISSHIQLGIAVRLL